MYDVSFRPGVLYITEYGKVYARVHLDVVLGIPEYVPAPIPEDIGSIPNASGGKDFTVKLRAIGANEGIDRRFGTTLIELFTVPGGPGTVQTPTQIKSLIGDKIYNILVIVTKDRTEKKSGSGTINSDSDIDIED